MLRIDDIHGSRRDFSLEFETLLQTSKNIFFVAFTKNEKKSYCKYGFFLFCVNCKGESNGSVVNDVPGGTSEPTLTEPAGENDSPRLHQKNSSDMFRGYFFTSSLFTLHFSLNEEFFWQVIGNSE